jgi:type IV pilus assembly protein PilC
MNKKAPQKVKTSFKMPEFTFFSYSKFSIKKQTFFAKRLAFLIKAGVPMLESVTVMRRQAKARGDIRVYDKIVADISNGQSLAGSLSKFNGVFGNFAVNVIKAGESSGTLTSNLSYLAEELKKKDLLRKKIMSALLYPGIILTATFGITGMLVAYIFPKIMPIFSSLNVDLPLSTRIVIAVSTFLRDYGLWVALGLVLFVIILILLKKYVSAVQYTYDGLIFHIPFMGPIIKNYNLTNALRTLGLLLRSGISLTQSLEITADTTDNLQYRYAFEKLSGSIMKGKTISDFLHNYPHLFPDITIHMVSVGEKTGNLSNTLTYLSEYYENEFDEQTKNLSSALEPVLMIVMGILVGFVAVSVITPIYEITTNIHR